MLLKADSDDKYTVVDKETHTKADGTKYVTYTKLDDAKALWTALRTMVVKLTMN